MFYMGLLDLASLQHGRLTKSQHTHIVRLITHLEQFESRETHLASYPSQKPQLFVSDHKYVSLHTLTANNESIDAFTQFLEFLCQLSRFDTQLLQCLKFSLLYT